MKSRIVGMLAIAALAVITGLTLFGPQPQASAAALTNGQSPQYKASYEFPVRMYAGVIYRGSLVAVSNGIAYPAVDSTYMRVIGVADDTVDNSATAFEYSATRRCSVRQGIFAFANLQTGVDASTNAVFALQVSDVGKPAYVVDDNHVCGSTNAFATVAGTVAYVDPDLRTVWVDIGKVWAGSAALIPYVLPASSAGLSGGRLYIVNTATITNGVGIVP